MFQDSGLHSRSIFFPICVLVLDITRDLIFFSLSKPVDRHHFFKGKHSTVNTIIQCLPFSPGSFSAVFQSRTGRHIDLY